MESSPNTGSQARWASTNAHLSNRNGNRGTEGEMVTTAVGVIALELEATMCSNDRVNKWTMVYSHYTDTATKESSIALHSGMDGSYYQHEVVCEPSLISSSMF